jgi:hypothetical protein
VKGLERVDMGEEGVRVGLHAGRPNELDVFFVSGRVVTSRPEKYRTIG